MEIFLHLWDELDDWSAACRHLTAATVEEVAQIPGLVSAAVAAFAVWLARIPS
jgi:hypothetical protein